MPKRILTAEVLAGIPALLAQGFNKSEIAKQLGCKESTLVVRCSTAGISLCSNASLRRRKRIELRAGSPLSLSQEALASLRNRAVLMGCSELQLVSDLLEAIAQDDLYDAVLDAAPLQPQMAIISGQFSRSCSVIPSQASPACPD